jgi:hypothetical protein
LGPPYQGKVENLSEWYPGKFIEKITKGGRFAPELARQERAPALKREGIVRVVDEDLRSIFDYYNKFYDWYYKYYLVMTPEMRDEGEEILTGLRDSIASLRREVEVWKRLLGL